MFDQITSAMGLKGSAYEHHLKQASDSPTEEETTIEVPDDFGLFTGIPASFSWREKMPHCVGPIED